VRPGRRRDAQNPLDVLAGTTSTAGAFYQQAVQVSCVSTAFRSLVRSQKTGKNRPEPVQCPRINWKTFAAFRGSAAGLDLLESLAATGEFGDDGVGGCKLRAISSFAPTPGSNLPKAFSAPLRHSAHARAGQSIERHSPIPAGVVWENPGRNALRGFGATQVDLTLRQFRLQARLFASGASRSVQHL
jgi:hypothetical protein